VYPYFIFHYTFNKVIMENAACAALWNDAPPFLAEWPHYIQFQQRETHGIENAKRAIEDRDIPMHKLDWRVDCSTDYWSIILPYIRGKS
jgi:hypothetical protein